MQHHKMVELDNIFPIVYKKFSQLKRKANRLIDEREYVCVVVEHQRNPYKGRLKAGEFIFVVLTLDETNHEKLYGLIKEINPHFILINNNCIQTITSDPLLLTERFQTSVVVVHDWDCHHWYTRSLESALHCDIYVPAHKVSNLLVSRMMPHPIEWRPVGSIQWSEEFLTDKLKSLTLNERDDSPLGKYFFYPDAVFRNRIVKTFNEIYPSVGWADTNYHSHTDDQKWKEWTRHKVHLICPVSGDIPIRFFDALVSGGLPCVPVEIIPSLNAISIPKHYYCVYTTDDLLEPRKFIDRAVEISNSYGDDGALERSKYTLRNYSPTDIAYNVLKFSLSTIFKARHDYAI
jgi:hypothetical protein